MAGHEAIGREVHQWSWWIHGWTKEASLQAYIVMPFGRNQDASSGLHSYAHQT